MRVILAPIDAASAALPERDMLEEARHLGSRFPEAGLHPVVVIRASDLDRRADPAGKTRVWLALEALQITGSFKVRGALLALSRMVETRTHVVAASAGNHGVGVAYAARVLGLHAKVVVPESAPL